MKAYKVKWYSPSDFHTHAFCSGVGIYIPSKKVVLFEEIRGTFSSKERGISFNKEFIDSIESALSGEKDDMFTVLEEIEIDGKIINDTLIEREKKYQKHKNNTITIVEEILKEFELDT